MAIQSVKRFLRDFAFATFFTGVIASVTSAQPHQSNTTPSWIWHSLNHAEVEFSHKFDIARPITQATLRVATQYTGCEIQLDHRPLALLEAYDPLLTTNVEFPMDQGSHSLTVRCAKVDGPSSFFLVLDLQFTDGSSQSIVSDDRWVVQAEEGGNQTPAIERHAVSRKLLIPPSRRIGIAPTDNYEQWKQALGDTDASDPATFQVTDGFGIRLVRAAQEGEDSWVSFSFDPDGRIIVAKEEAGLLRMTLAPDGNSVTRTEQLDETLKECRGLVWRRSQLFANANDSRALFRMEMQSDGRLAEPLPLLLTPGGAGHGRNDLRVGPDGMLYSIHGDSVELPTDAIDYTSPFRAARRGEKTSEGHLVRLDPESGKVELLTAGLRNPFGIDLNADGEAFTYDADAEYDMGSPWYRPTRVNHLVIGGDYGWRGVTKSWPSYYSDRADNAHPNLDIGKGSPTAVRFGTQSHFPQRYREALFVLDWAYGRVLAVNMIPRGASYLMAAETFLQGRPLNVTDIEFAADGSMYLITGGRKTQSAIYRVQFTGKQPKLKSSKHDDESACETYSARSRDRRRRFEAMLLDEPKRENVAIVWDSLSDPDPWIQYAAANVLERQPVEWWSDRALSDNSIRGLLSLARSDETKYFEPILHRLNKLSVDDKPPSQQLAILQSYQLTLASPARIDRSLLAATTDRLVALYPSELSSVNRLLSQLLTDLNAPEATSTTVQLIRSTSDPVEQLQYLYVLRHAKNGWTSDDRQTYFRTLAQASQFLGGAGMPDFLAKIREESMATLNAVEQERYAKEFEPNASESLNEPAFRAFVRQWTVDELLDSFDANRKPDLVRGKALFVAASCSQCHRIAGEGTLIGPDLTAASGRYRRRDLLTAIIDPSQVIAENYRSIQIVTVDGETYTGQVAYGGDYRSPVLRLATDASKPFEVTEIDKTQIESQKFSPVSWMPTGLLNTLSVNEAQDLVAYIESGGR